MCLNHPASPLRLHTQAVGLSSMEAWVRRPLPGLSSMEAWVRRPLPGTSALPEGLGKGTKSTPGQDRAGDLHSV